MEDIEVVNKKIFEKLSVFHILTLWNIRWILVNISIKPKVIAIAINNSEK